MATNDKVVSWTVLKQIRTVKNNTPFQYIEIAVKYDIWIQDGSQVYTTEIWKDTTAVSGINITQNNIDKADWETNYKAGARGLSPIDVNVQNTVSVSGSVSADVSGISALVETGKVYSLAGRFNMASAGTNNPLIYIKNPTGSGKILKIVSSRFGVDVENNFANFIWYANPTITANGIAYTPVNRYVGGGFGASAIEVYNFPTVSANGTEISNIEIGTNSNSLQADELFALFVKADSSILITGDPKSNNRAAVITVVWAEI